MDVGVFTLLQVTERNVRSTRRFTIYLVKDPQSRRSTSLNAVTSTGSLAHRSTRLKTVPSIGLPARRVMRLISLEASVTQPGPTYLLALPVETSTSYASRGSTAGTIYPAQGITLRVYMCLGLGKFCSVLNYLFFCQREPIGWLSFFFSHTII